MRDLRQTKNYAKYIHFLGWEVKKKNGIYIYLKKLPILGYMVKIQRPKECISKKFHDDLRRRKRIFAIYIEPIESSDADFYKNKCKFKLDKTTSLPSKTIQFNLRKSLDNIKSNMHHKTRYNIGLAQRRGVSIERSEDVKRFSDFWHKSAKKRGFYLSMDKEIKALYKAFGKNAYLMFAYLKGKLIAADFLIKTPDTLSYMYAASTSVGNKNFAPTLLVWKSMELGKHLKCKVFDFEGIYDSRFPIKSWRGFTRFKESFGGEKVSYPGTLRRYYLPRRL